MNDSRPDNGPPETRTDRRRALRVGGGLVLGSLGVTLGARGGVARDRSPGFSCDKACLRRCRRPKPRNEDLCGRVRCRRP